MMIKEVLFPSFTPKLLLESIQDKPHTTLEETMPLLLEIAEKSINAEEEHILTNARNSLDLMRKRFEDQIKERNEILDTFIEGLSYADETDTRSPRELINELTGVVRAPISLSNNDQRLLRNDPYQTIDLISEQVENFLVVQSVTRLIGSVERRLLESLQLIPSELAQDDWKNISENILEAVSNLYEKRRSRYLGDNGDGLLSNQIQSQLKGSKDKIDDRSLLQALITITQEERKAFDKRTHRQITVLTPRFSHVYHTAHILENRSEEKISENILTHLIEAQDEMTRLWGLNVWDQIFQSTLKDLPETAQQGIAKIVGESDFENIKEKKLNSFSGNEKNEIIAELGRRELTETYRKLILRVISELWIEYLTQMEALRVSIGLEAYAQRDPLVMYKTRASEMFQRLFEDMRLSVVSRMFTFRPRQLATAQAVQSQSRGAQIRSRQDQTSAQPSEQPKSRRKRRRRRKKK
jgi:preprotein translocase subunit SecA